MIITLHIDFIDLKFNGQNICFRGLLVKIESLVINSFIKVLHHQTSILGSKWLINKYVNIFHTESLISNKNA